MEKESKSGVPIWFWIIGIVLLLWNLMGLAVFGAHIAMLNNDEMLQQSGLNDAQIELMKDTPFWVTIAFGIAVVFGVLGCIALLMRKKWAIMLFGISLLGVLAQHAYVFFMSDSLEVMGIGLAPIIILVAIAVIPLAMNWANKGWLR